MKNELYQIEEIETQLINLCAYDDHNEIQTLNALRLGLQAKIFTNF